MCYNNWKPGEMFEDVVLSNLYACYGKNMLRLSSQKEDFEEGVDFYLAGVPIDICLSVSNKQVSRNPKKFEKLESCTVNFYMRHGNNHHVFKQPVLVIEVSTFIWINRQMYAEMIVEEMLERGVFETAMDLYIDITDKTDQQ